MQILKEAKDAHRRGARRDLTGARFGKLVCLEPTDARDTNGAVVWRCRCDCGEECLASSTQLHAGDKKSCGCLFGPKPEEYIGRRFGALTVVDYAGKIGGKHLWHCRCDCGGEAAVAQSNLVSGHTKSCGCLQREMYRENLKLVDGTSVTMIENRMRQPIKTNTSGVSGVYYRSGSGEWCAQITFKGETHFLGAYRSIEDAIRARKRGEEMFDDFLERYYGHGEQWRSEE